MAQPLEVEALVLFLQALEEGLQGKRVVNKGPWERRESKREGEGDRERARGREREIER